MTRKYPNEIIRDEHDETINAKKVEIIASNATIHAVVNAGSGGTSSTDDGAFTVGTDAGTPYMGLYESTPDTVDDGDVGVVGMTANRWAKQKLESAATIFAVVNAGAASDPKIFIGLTTTVIGSAPTIFAVVNTAAAGQSSVVLDDSIAKIGFATVHQGDDPWNVAVIGNITVDQVDTVTAVTNITNPVALKGNVTLSDSKTYIGLTTVTAGRGHQYIGLATVRPVGLTTVVQTGNTTVWQASAARTITGNVTLSDSKTYIGLTTTTLGVGNQAIGKLAANSGVDIGDVDVTSNTAWVDPNTYIGLVTVDIGSQNGISFAGNVTLDPGSQTAILGNITVEQGDDPWNVAVIGNVTVDQVDVVTAVTDITNPVALKGNVTLSDSKTYIGLVTAEALNAGTTKTIIPQPFGFADASIATIFIPTNTFYLTHLTLNANATVRVNVKSGPTYLVGNASIGITLNPGGGWVENGGPDSPIYDGLADAGSLVIEKFDLTGTSAEIGGKVMYYEE